MFWKALCLLSSLAHYTWPVWGYYSVSEICQTRAIWQTIIILFVAWVVANLASRGCPFSYLHQWLEVKAGWRKSVTYGFKDSNLYRHIIHPLEFVVRWFSRLFTQGNEQRMACPALLFLHFIVQKLGLKRKIQSGTMK